MPTYVYRCPVCNRVEAKQRTIEYRDDAPTCDHRDGLGATVKMERMLAMPMVRVNGPAVPRGS